MKQEKNNLELDKNGNLRKKGFFSWISNFGYYYKSYIIVAVVVIAFFTLLYFSINSAQADMYLYLVTAEDSSLTEDQVNALFTNANGYVKDFDEDGTPYFVPKWLKLTGDPDDTVYADIDKALDDENIVCFSVDEAGYAYLSEKGVLRDLEFFGLEGYDEYRILLNDTGYMHDVNADESLYMVMKYMPDERYSDYFVSLLTSSVVDICKELIAGK